MAGFETVRIAAVQATPVILDADPEHFETRWRVAVLRIVRSG